MSAPAELLEAIQARGAELVPAGERLRVRAPEPLPEDLMGELRRHRDELLRLLTVLADACRDLPLSPQELRARLAPEGLADLAAGRIDAETLRAFADAVHASDAREAGHVPVGWTRRAHCRGCGPVYLWAPVSVDGCPWCLNRAKGLLVPRPPHAGAYCIQGRTVSGVLVTSDPPYPEDTR